MTLEQWRQQPDADKDVWLAADAERQAKIAGLLEREDIRQQLALLPSFLALVEAGIL